MIARVARVLSIVGLASTVACTTGIPQAPVSTSSRPISVNANDVVSETALLDEIKNDVVEIGKYHIVGTTAPNSCPVDFQAIPQSLEIDYQAAQNITITGTASGNIPLPVILTPSVQLAGSGITTQKVVENTTINASSYDSHSALTAPAPPNSGSLPFKDYLRQRIESEIAAQIGTRHTPPCSFTPKNIIVSVSIQVENKVGGGISINAIIASGGVAAVQQNDITQTIILTYDTSDSKPSSFI